MRDFLATISIVGCALIFLGCGTQPKPSTEQEVSIVGEWKSIALEGSEIDGPISSVELSFQDSSKLSGTATMKDGSTDTRTGTWSIVSNQLTMTTNGNSQKSKIEWKSDLLVIHDSVLDVRVVLKRK